MQTLLALGVTILTAAAPVQSQPAHVQAKPVTINFVNATFEDAISFLAKYAQVTIELDQTVTPEMRLQKVAGGRLVFRDVSFDEALAELTRLHGLSYTVVDEKMIRIFKKA